VPTVRHDFRYDLSEEKNSALNHFNGRISDVLLYMYSVLSSHYFSLDRGSYIRAHNISFL